MLIPVLNLNAKEIQFVYSKIKVIIIITFYSNHNTIVTPYYYFIYSQLNVAVIFIFYFSTFEKISTFVRKIKNIGMCHYTSQNMDSKFKFKHKKRVRSNKTIYKVSRYCNWWILYNELIKYRQLSFNFGGNYGDETTGEQLKHFSLDASK